MRLKIGQRIHVSDKMQQNYSYEIVAPFGEVQSSTFQPHFSPKEMLRLGVFEGKYLNDCQSEFPNDGFDDAKICQVADAKANYFGIKSRSSLSIWRQKGWIQEPDPRGWFQWYCRYYLGRRIPVVDAHQIKRWRAFSRHSGQVKANCMSGDVFCRPKQRQALLQWAHDPFV